MTKSDKSPALLAPEWLTLGEAVERLGKSQSTLERLVATGAVQSKLEPRPGRKPERLYRASDLARPAQESGPTSRALTVKSLTVAAPFAPGGSPPPDTPGAVERVSVTTKLWLTLDEAEAYSGLGVRTLRGLIADGGLQAFKGGPHGAWVIRRTSLEAFAG